MLSSSRNGTICVWKSPWNKSLTTYWTPVRVLSCLCLRASYLKTPLKSVSNTSNLPNTLPSFKNHKIPYFSFENRLKFTKLLRNGSTLKLFFVFEQLFFVPYEFSRLWMLHKVQIELYFRNSYGICVTFELDYRVHLHNSFLKLASHRLSCTETLESLGASAAQDL